MPDEFFDQLGVWIEENGRLVLGVVLPIVCAILVGLIVHKVLFSILNRVVLGGHLSTWDNAIRRLRRPSRYLFPLLAVMLVLRWIQEPKSVLDALQLIDRLGLTAVIGWLVVSTWRVFESRLVARYPIDVEDNLEARRAQTQLVVLRRVIVFIVVLVTFAIMLLSFPAARQIGTSLLASAGIIGLVVGMAARPALSNLIAGIQLALTQPIRLDDVVIMEGEWGRIEEITPTYVVVRVWDQRRLIVPLGYVLEKPFQNWTRTTAELLGTAYIYVDYTVPVDEVRDQLKRILDESHMWDGKIWGLQVTNATERTVELRALMSAPDASKAWDLRCHVREHLLRYVQSTWPESLPKARLTLDRGISLQNMG